MLKLSYNKLDKILKLAATGASIPQASSWALVSRQLRRLVDDWGNDTVKDIQGNTKNFLVLTTGGKVIYITPSDTHILCMHGARAIACCLEASAAYISGDGAIYTFGDNEYGQLGRMDLSKKKGNQASLRSVKLSLLYRSLQEPGMSWRYLKPDVPMNGVYWLQAKLRQPLLELRCRRTFVSNKSPQETRKDCY